MRLYIAGKVAKNSTFGKHHWRDEFCAELARLSGLELDHLDPLSTPQTTDPKEVFAQDCRLINKADALVVYLSDDISVGGSQEILIARYLHKPVIGLAPLGGKFNGCRREMLGKIIENYQDPFVFATCDLVCSDVEAVAQALQKIKDIKSDGFTLIDAALRS
ncbi:MAG TPA: hypothetical protein VLF69_05060 [Candidatus Saccharimonadales bacterium]|nr:hypothetical protein [Candidatus Saccharimonadales bacterium]